MKVNKTKHTAGKWETFIDHSRRAATYPKTLVVSNGVLVANCLNKNMKKEESEANARLTAGAPRLLNNLLGFIHSVEHEGVVHGRVSEAVENAKQLIEDLTGIKKELIHTIETNNN